MFKTPQFLRKIFKFRNKQKERASAPLSTGSEIKRITHGGNYGYKRYGKWRTTYKGKEGVETRRHVSTGETRFYKYGRLLAIKHFGNFTPVNG